MSTTVIISGAKLRKYLTCVRLPFMDEFADRQRAISASQPNLPNDPEPDPTVVGADLTIVRGVSAAIASTEDDAPVIVYPPARLRGPDLIQWTQQQMREGVDGIARGLLGHGNWLGSPELLSKRPGVSRLGRYLYEPIGRRWSSKESIRALAIPLTLYGLLVEHVQGARPLKVAWERATTGELETRPLAKYVNETRLAIGRVEEMLQRRVDPGPRLKTDCGRCRWRAACQGDALQQQHVTLLPSIRSSAVEKLHSESIKSLGDLRAAPSSVLSRATGIRDAETLLRLRAQADAYITDVSTVVGTPDLPVKTRSEAFLDFEADAVWGEPCLIGLLVRRDRRTTYTPFLARDETDIARACRDFVKAVERLPKSTRLYHYGSFERYVLSRFPRGLDISQVESRLVDVLPFIRKHAGIPSRSFGLKDVAAVLGVRLPECGLEGRVAPMWWEAWVRTQKPKYRRLLLTYNEADLRAVMAVLRWLRVGPRWKK
jgi:predicted RecB family nuclease